MEKSKAVGAVIFRKDDKISYLVLHSNLGHWDLAKGITEKGENELDTLLREVFEETGINDLKIINGFKEVISYSYNWENKLVRKKVVFYLAETKTKAIRLSKEHTEYKWLGFSDARKQLTFGNIKKVLEKADRFLNKKGSYL